MDKQVITFYDFGSEEQEIARNYTARRWTTPLSELDYSRIRGKIESA